MKEMIAWLMPLQEYVVLPAAHSQQDATDKSDMVCKMRIDRDLSRRPAGKIVGREIIIDLDDRDGTSSRDIFAHVLQYTGCLKLACCDRIENVLDLPFEHL